MKFSIKDSFSNCDQIRSLLCDWFLHEDNTDNQWVNIYLRATVENILMPDDVLVFLNALKIHFQNIWPSVLAFYSLSPSTPTFADRFFNHI